MPKGDANVEPRLLSRKELAEYIADMTLAMMRIAESRGLTGLAHRLADASAAAAAAASESPMPHLH